MKILIFALISIAATKTAFSEVEDRKSKMVLKPPFNMQQIGELITSNNEKEMGKKVSLYFGCKNEIILFIIFYIIRQGSIEPEDHRFGQ